MIPENVPSSNIKWNPQLAHLRFLAAFLVFCFHVFHLYYGEWRNHAAYPGFSWISEGYTGVSLFFVLSGYLFMQIAIRAKGEISYGQFVKNRCLRILPLYIVFFILGLCIARDNIKSSDLFYFFISNIGESPTSKYMVTAAVWTIAVEFSFYLIFPFLARFTLTYGPYFLIKAVFLVVVLKLAAYLSSEKATYMIYTTIIGRLDQFLIGMLFAQLADIYLPKIIQYRWVAIAAISVWFILELQGYYGGFFGSQPKNVIWIFWPSIEAIGWSCLILTYTRLRINLPQRATELLETGANISFSFYLWHLIVIFLFQKLLNAPHWGMQTFLNVTLASIATFIVSWIIAQISYSTIEAPFLNLRKKYVLS